MNTIITYNFKNEIKNCILNVFSNNIFELVEKTLTTILTSHTSDAYLELFNALQVSIKNTVKNCITILFEKLDAEYRCSSERIRLYYVNKSGVPRTIVTVVGELTFKRTYYVSKTSKQSFFYIDKVFNLPKYDHFDPIIKGITISNSFETSQAQAARDMSRTIANVNNLSTGILSISVSRQAVFNWIKEWNTPDIIPKSSATPDTLYVMADEKYIGSQDTDKDIMVKCFVTFEGIQDVGKNRRSLINRSIFSHYGSNAWGAFMDYIAKKYDFSKIKNIYLLGDGASWIKSGITELQLEKNNNVKFHLCEFHFKQAIHHITSRVDERNNLLNIFQTKRKKDFIEAVNLIIERDIGRTDIINQKLKYILKNYHYIKNMLNLEIGSSMESHISHFVASLFASRPKGFSTKNITKYLKLADYKHNNINIFNLYLKSYTNTESKTITEETLDYSIFEIPHYSNIPVLEGSSASPLYEVLYNLAH